MSKRIPIILGLLFVIFAVWLHVNGVPSIRLVLSRLEQIAYDMQLRTELLTHPANLTNTAIAIVDVDDKSLDREGRWPWPRAKLATLVSRLQSAGAVVIAFDMVFPQTEVDVIDEVAQELKKENLMTPTFNNILNKVHPLFDNDIQFAASLAGNDAVIGISFLERPRVTGVIMKPLITLMTPQEKSLGFITMHGVDGANPIIASTVNNEGFINVFPDSDGIIRRVPILIRYGDGLYPSLALEAVRLYLLSNISLVTAKYGNTFRLEGINLNNYVIPTDSRAQVLIPFVGKGFSYPYFSATDILNNKIPANAFAGKIVFVGASAIGLGDIKATAIENPYPGVEVHASVADGILKKSFSYKPDWALGAEVFLIVVLGIILALICPYLGPRLLSILIFVIPLALLFVNNYLREKTGLLLAIFIPLVLAVSIALLNLIYGYLFETRRREHIKEMFGQYVPEEHIDQMLKSHGSYGLYGEDRDMTVLFADIRNFTAISEDMTAKQLKDYLNAYLNPMTEIIFKYHGTIDKYVGDLIMAFWGAPLSDKKHAQHAMSAALDIQHEVAQFNKALEKQNVAPIHVGIGLNSGMMSVGDMGSTFRRNYTVLGDAVNLGSRVEELTKYYGVKIIAAENTVHGQEKFVTRLLDKVRVKGKHKGVAIYEVLGKKGEVSHELQNEIIQYEAALSFYFQRQWKLAEELFVELSKNHPHKKLYTLYLQRLVVFSETPPPVDWDGVFNHINK